MRQKKEKNQQAITLIALIITIIILLILAGITLVTLSGENGILTRASDAKIETTVASELEKINLSVLAARDINTFVINEEKLKIELNNFFGNENEYVLTNRGDKYIIEILSTNNLYSLKNDREAIKIENVEFGKIYESDTDIQIENEIIEIPAGFAVSAIEEEKSLEDGIVIYKIPQNEEIDWNTDEFNEEGNNISDGILDVQQKYDQFVWIPVQNAILDCSNMENTQANLINEVRKSVSNGIYPMACKLSNGNYTGILYNFNYDDELTISVENTWQPISKVLFHEPDILNDRDNEIYLSQINEILGKDYNLDTWNNELQNDFNNMINSIYENGGFWIGRYETSNFSNNSNQQIKIIKGTTNGIYGINWYKMYAHQKKYKIFLNNSNFHSSMIWGCQWDQIMIYMRNIKNDNRNSYYVVDSITMGNFNTNDDFYDGVAPTGFFKVNNVYDLAGNLHEWTLENYMSSSRTRRGGSYQGNLESDAREFTAVSQRSSYYYPDIGNNITGSRLTLY